MTARRSCAQATLRLGQRAVQNGHRMENRTDIDCAFIAISAGDKNGGGEYSDIDMTFAADGYFHKDGTPYPTTRIR